MADPGTGRGQWARFSLRTIAFIWGAIGAVLALIVDVDIRYTSVHAVRQIAGVPGDSAHFLYGLLAVIAGLAGASLAPIAPLMAGLMLAVVGIGFFFIVGWWALIASPFFLVAALLTLSNRRASVPAG
jgi:hypothetical protein